MARHRHRERAIAIALLVSLVLWNLPFGGFVLYPFKLLATWIHELSHGMVMLVTGAGFDRMEIYRDTSGLAFAERGAGPAARAAIAAAGYMGTPLVGAIMLVLGQRAHIRARVVLGTVGFLMAASAVFVVENPFGVAAVAACAALFTLTAALAGERIAAIGVNFVAVQACINALLDIRILFRGNLMVNGQVMGKSDAHNMADATFGSSGLWAAIWLVWSFALLFFALYLTRPKKPPGAVAAG